MAVIEPLEINHFRILTFTSNVRASKCAYELTVTNYSEFLSSGQRIASDLFSDKALKRLATVKDVFVGLKLIIAHERRDPCISQILVTEVILQF